MKRQDALQLIKTFPDAPGVYFFTRGNGANSEILYIGKATSLRDRVRSYFAKDIGEVRGPLITKMLSEFDTIRYEQTDSVLEALILEAHLIKKHQPPANVMEKDDKSFNFVLITKEGFPRVLIVRGRELLVSHLSHKPEDKLNYQIAYSFGPFPNGTQLKEALKIVRKVFPYRDEKCIPADEQKLKKNQKPKACFNRQIGLCPGVCTGEISAGEYAHQIKNIVLFFEGNKKQLVRDLEKEMKLYAKNRQFERASEVKRQIFALGHIQDVSLIKENKAHLSGRGISGKVMRIESYDIAHMSGQNVVGVMTVVEDGEVKRSDYRKFKIKDDPGVNDTKALREVLTRRLSHTEWPLPTLIVVDGGLAQRNAVNGVLREHFGDTPDGKGMSIPVVSVVKDERHRAREIQGDTVWLAYEADILLSNAEAHRFAIGFHSKLRRKLK